MIDKIRSILKSLTTELDLLEVQSQSSVVMKKVDTDQRLILGVVLEPDSFDLQNDIYSAEEVRKACENFNTHCMKGNVEHLITTEKLIITKSFILEVDAHIGEQFVKSGSWLMEMKVNDDELWSLTKSGEFGGFSIGGKATVEDIE